MPEMSNGDKGNCESNTFHQRVNYELDNAEARMEDEGFDLEGNDK